MISAIVLAAGLSSRMGRPKMLLPWKDTTVLGQVVSTLIDAGVSEIVVVTGANREEIEDLLPENSARFEYNPDYANGEMLTSVKAGLKALDQKSQAALIALGDQPQIQRHVIERLIEAYRISGSKIVVPSYRMRRGHPWLVDRMLWSQILAIAAPLTLRDFLEEQSGLIEYLTVDNGSILSDLDTPQDYLQEKPG